MDPPPYKKDIRDAERARTEAAFNAPPYSDAQGAFYRVRYARTCQREDGALLDQFDVRHATDDAAQRACWKRHEVRSKGCTEGVSFYVLVPHRTYYGTRWLRMSSDALCAAQSVGCGALGVACWAWGAYMLWARHGEATL